MLRDRHPTEHGALMLAFLVAWYGVWWRLRGGALTALTGFDPGTGGMRAIAASAMAAPLMLVSWHYAVMFVVFWVTWSLAGWGAFQGMGQEAAVEISNPIAKALNSLGLRKLSIDLAGMAIEGFFCCAMISIAPLVQTHRISVLPLLGLFFAMAYLVPQRLVKFPSTGKFATAGSEWGEVLVGLLVGAMVALEVS